MSADLITLKAEKLIYGGDALGHLPDGRAAFLPFTLPGEVVRARLLREGSGFARMQVVEVLEAATGRIQPRCPHFGVCGGCHYQHMDYPAQLAAKQAILQETLVRTAHIVDPPLRPIVASPHPWNYRNHVQFHLDRSGQLCFVGSDDRSLMPVTECLLPEPGLDEIWRRLQFEPDLGLERVSLRLGVDDSVMVMLASPEVPALELEAGLSVVHLQGDEAVVLAGDEALVMEVNSRLFRVSATSFFQVNTSIAGSMVSHLVERVSVKPGTPMLDVFCGVGLFSAFFAARGAQVTGIELSPAACDDFSVNLDEFEGVSLYQASAAEVLPSLDLNPQVVLLDPPRAGLEARVVEALLAKAPQQIAYISCDPATLGRDLARLIAGGYRLLEVTPFDLFPQTYHIESISLLEKQ